MGFILISICLAAGLASPLAASEHSLAVGAHFWKTLDDLADDGFDGIEDDGYALVVAYRYEPQGIFFLQIDAEYYPDGYGGSTDSALSPIAYLGVGGNWYAAVGVGVTYSSDFEDDVSDPFYAARIGWELDLLPGISVDIHANYRAGAFDELENADTDAITLGAMVRFTF
ncbi:MAG: porin family protein [Holophagales bacterium]|nr:porin family protein [Holophagales bacterium]